MKDESLTERYNYDSFVQEKFAPWMNFDASPPLGERTPDFPLWSLQDRSESTLLSILQEADYTVVEFGSFT